MREVTSTRHEGGRLGSGQLLSGLCAEPKPPLLHLLNGDNLASALCFPVRSKDIIHIKYVKGMFSVQPGILYMILKSLCMTLQVIVNVSSEILGSLGHMLKCQL